MILDKSAWRAPFLADIVSVLGIVVIYRTLGYMLVSKYSPTYSENTRLFWNWLRPHHVLHRSTKSDGPKTSPWACPWLAFGEARMATNQHEGFPLAHNV